MTQAAANDPWSAAAYSRNARFVSELGAPALDLLAPRPGEAILDLGCGDGALSERLAAAGARVTAVDASPDMVAAARARGLDALLANAETLDLPARFDAVFSNAALHWMTRPDAVIAGVARALKPGGRFVGEFGGAGNVAAIRTAIIAVLAADFGIETTLDEIWYFPTEADYAERLRAAGFAIEEIALLPRPTPVGAGIEAWLTTLAAPALAVLPAGQRDAATARIAGLLAPALCDPTGQWRVDYVRLRFRAVLR